jgi:hypothetical protein
MREVIHRGLPGSFSCTTGEAHTAFPDCTLHAVARA